VDDREAFWKLSIRARATLDHRGVAPVLSVVHVQRLMRAIAMRTHRYPSWPPKASHLLPLMIQPSKLRSALYPDNVFRRETNCQDLAIGALRSGNHHADGCSAG